MSLNSKESVAVFVCTRPIGNIQGSCIGISYSQKPKSRDKKKKKRDIVLPPPKKKKEVQIMYTLDVHLPCLLMLFF